MTDVTGGRIPGATVTLTSDATGVEFTTVTNDTGNDVFEAVQVGRHTIGSGRSSARRLRASSATRV